MEAERVLITGATGFIGGRLARALVGRHQVKAVVRDVGSAKARDLSEVGVEIVAGDLADPGSLGRAALDADVIYHLAEQKGFSRRAYRVNTAATRVLIDAARAGRARRFVFASTIAVNAPDESGQGQQPSPRYLHAVSKAEGEQYGFAAHRTDGFPFVVIRPAAVYARRSPLVDGIASWVRSHPRLGWPVFGNGSNTMHFGQVDDLVHAFELAAERREAVGNAFVVVDEAPISWRAFLEAVAGAFGLRLRIRKIPVGAAKALATLIEWACAVVRIALPARLLVDVLSLDMAFTNEKARRQLGFIPRFSTPLEGLRYEDA